MNAAVEETNAAGTTTEATLRAARRQQRSRKKTKKALLKQGQLLLPARQATARLEEYLLSNTACVNTSFNTEAAVNGSPSRMNTKGQGENTELRPHSQNETSVGNAVDAPVKINDKSSSTVADHSNFKAYGQDHSDFKAYGQDNIWNTGPSDAADETMSSLSLSIHDQNSGLLTSGPTQLGFKNHRYNTDRIERRSRQFGDLAVKSGQSTHLTSYKTSIPRLAHVKVVSSNRPLVSETHKDVATAIELRELDNRLSHQRLERAANSKETRTRLLQESNDKCLRDKYKQERQLQLSVLDMMDQIDQRKKGKNKRGHTAADVTVKRKSNKSRPGSKAAGEGDHHRHSSVMTPQPDSHSRLLIGIQTSKLPRRRRQREQGSKWFWTRRLMCWIRAKKPTSMG